MKKECRKEKRVAALLMVAMIALMILLTACDTGNEINSSYNLDVVEHTSDFYVNDFAGVFSEAQKNELIAKAVAFDEEYSGVQVVITTVESLDKAVLMVKDSEGKENVNPEFTIEQVSCSMYSQYGIGQDDMGILVLFSTGDREVRIETGRQMQFYITDSISGRLLDDYGMKYFQDDKFAEGLVSVQSAVIDEIKKHVSVDWYTDSQVTQSDSENVAIGDVTGDVTENSDENVVGVEKTEEKDSEAGILFGFFGSISAAIVAFVAFIRQRFKGNAEKSELEKEKQEEIETLKAIYQSDLAEQIRHHERMIKEKDNYIQELNDKVSDAQSEIGALKEQLQVITDKYARIQMLHPECNFESEVQAMIESEHKKLAEECDGELTKVLSISATKDNADVFENALTRFDLLEPEVKQYVTSDRTTIQMLLDQAVSLREEFEKKEQEKRDKDKAKMAYDKIKRVYEDNPNGNYKTYEALHDALAIFLELSVAERTFFPDNTLIENLNIQHRIAEEDHNNYEAASMAESNVKSIIGIMSSADEDDRDKLERAMKYYSNLSSAQKGYFSDELLCKLKKLIQDADDDYKRQQRRRDEEQAARSRFQQRHTLTSFSHQRRSNFTGRGGRPSGGGATRRF